MQFLSFYRIARLFVCFKMKNKSKEYRNWGKKKNIETGVV